MTPSEDVAFLLSYRALCFEIYMKQVADQTLQFARDNLDRGTDFARQCEIQCSLAEGIFSNKLGYEEHLRLKIAWDAALMSGDRKNFEWSFFQLDGILPVATSGVYYPEHDFTGRELQELDAPIGSLGLMGFNILPIGGKTTAVFGWLDKKSQNRRLIETLRDVPDSHLASALVQFAFDTSDNLFVRESWWEGLDPQRKSYLEENLRNSTPGNKWSNGLVPKSPPLLRLPILARK